MNDPLSLSEQKGSQQISLRIIAVTGDVPWKEQNLVNRLNDKDFYNWSTKQEQSRECIALAIGRNGFVCDKGKLHNVDICQHEQVIVIGRSGFDEQYLKWSVTVGKRYSFSCRYLSQEAFFDFLGSGSDQPYYQGDPRVWEHPGLRFLTQIGFVWPTTEAFSSGGGTGAISGRLRNIHELKLIYGYTVAEGILVSERHHSLARAVVGLGLHEVAYQIAGNIRRNKLNHTNHLEGAISRWEYDLAWLKAEYYDGSIDSFLWPDYLAQG